MRPVTDFALERHDGPYESWPRRTRLFRNGADTGVRIGGYALRYQVEVAGRHLLVVDMDCPWEEETVVVLLDQDLRVQSTRRFGLPFGFYALEGDPIIIDDHRVDLGFGPQGTWRVTVRDVRPWVVGSFLGLERRTGGG